MDTGQLKTLRFFSWLEERARRIDSLLCVGLDPHLDQLPEPTGEAALGFCRRLIHATAEARSKRVARITRQAARAAASPNLVVPGPGTFHRGLPCLSWMGWASSQG